MNLPHSVAWRGMAACLLLVLALAGCRGPDIRTQSQSRVWSGLGASFLLPEGAWRIQTVTPDMAVTFTEKNGDRNITLMRVPARPNVSEWIALRSLFVAFREKKLVSEGQRELPSGGTAFWAEYDVREKDQTIVLRAAAVRSGESIYDLAQWGAGDASEFNSILNSLIFPGGPLGDQP